MGDNKLGIAGIITGIVFLIIAVTLIGSTASTVDDNSEAMTIDARCEAAGCVYDSLIDAGTRCRNGSGVSNVSCAVADTNVVYPLEGLFNTGGVIILLFIAGGLIVIVGIAFIKLKKK